MKHILSEEHKEHLRIVGVSDIGSALHVDEQTYWEFYEAWKRQFPSASHEFWHQKTLAQCAWKQQHLNNAASQRWVDKHMDKAIVFPNPNKSKKKFSKVRRFFGFASLLFVFLLFCPSAKAQFSQINSIQWQQGGSNITNGFYAYPFSVNCSTGMLCVSNGSAVTLTSTGGGGTGCVPSGVTATALLYDTGGGTCDDVAKITWNNGTSTLLSVSGLNFDFTPSTTFKFKVGMGSTITGNGTSGQPLLSNADGTFTPGDPLVSGFCAHDAVDTCNPVLIGGFASAAAPTNVSADGDAVNAWYLRNGSAVTNIASGGTLITLGQKTMANSFPVVFSSDQSSLAVTGPLTDAQLRASPVPISGTVTVTDGAGALNVIVDSGTLTTVSTVTNLSQLNGAAISMNTGARDAGTQRVTIATNDVVPVSQSGTWNLTNISGTISLPTGASTLAEQQTQTTALQLIDNLPLTQGSSTSGQSGVLIQGAVTTAAPSYTTAQTSPISLDTTGNVRITCTTCGITDNSAFTVGTTGGNVMMGYYTSGAVPTIASGNVGRLTMNNQSALIMTCPDGTCSGGGGGGGVMQVKDSANTSTNVGYYPGNLNLPVQETNSSALLAALQQLNLSKIGGVSLGTPTMFGQRPGLQRALAVNAFITDLPGVNLTAVNGVAMRGQTAGSVPVTIVAGAGSGGTAATDNSAFTAGATSVTPIGAIYTTSPPAVADGSVGAPRMDVNRILLTNCTVGCSGGATTPTDNFANPTTAGLSATFNMVYDGATWDMLRGTSVDGMLVNLGTNNDVTVTGTVAATQSGAWNITNVSGTVSLPTGASTLAEQQTQTTSLQLIDNIVSGNGVNITQFGNSNVVTGTGTGGAGIPRVTVSNDSNVLATQSGTWNIGTLTTVTNPVTVAQATAANLNATVVGTGTFSVQCSSGCSGGTLSNNNAPPTNNNGGVLAALANAAAPTYTEGNQVLLSTDLTGALRVSGSSGGGVAQNQVRNAANAWTDVGFYPGNQNLPVQEATAPALLTAINTLIATVKTDRVIGSLGQPIGSIGDSLKVVLPPSADGCSGTKGNVAISQTAATKLVPGVAGQRILVCYIRMVAGVAEIVSFTEGTGAACATNQLAVSGSTTAANGESYAANGGASGGTGLGTIAATSKQGNDLCLTPSGANRVSGNITYAYTPY